MKGRANTLIRPHMGSGFGLLFVPIELVAAKLESFLAVVLSIFDLAGIKTWLWRTKHSANRL